MTPTGEKRLEAAVGVLVALCTLTIAWCSYQGQRWDGLQTYRYAEANALRTSASRDAITAGQHVRSNAQASGLPRPQTSHSACALLGTSTNRRNV